MAVTPGGRSGDPILPLPSLFGDRDWKGWASALVKILVHRSALEASLQPQPTFFLVKLPKPNPGGLLVFVPDESGGPTLAYSDGSDWRRVYDNAVVS